jgi:hypothetical protein
MKPIFNDIESFYDKLLNVCKEKDFSVKMLGKIGKKYPYPIYFLDRDIRSGPKILVSSGFHGNEPAGPWGIVSFLMELDLKFISNIDVSFLPLVNPTGFVANVRDNEDGHDVNRGYMVPENRDDFYKPLTKEGKILKDHVDLLSGSAKDGLLCLHEAPIMDDTFFVYGYEKSSKSGEFTKLFRDIELKYFKPFPDGLTRRGLMSKDGIILHNYDGGFQDWLFREGGIERAVVTETPANNQPFSYRLQVNVKLIETLINYFKEKV